MRKQTSARRRKVALEANVGDLLVVQSADHDAGFLWWVVVVIKAAWTRTGRNCTCFRYVKNDWDLKVRYRDRTSSYLS